jgi:hypothetical protein
MEYIKGINLFNDISNNQRKKKGSRSSTPFEIQKNLTKKTLKNHLKDLSQIPKEL